MKRAILVVTGAYLCFIGAFVHRHMTYVDGFGWPWGLVLVLSATCAVVLAADTIIRLGSAWLGLGWGAALLVLQLSPGGSYLVASDWLGWTFTIGSLGLVVLGIWRTSRLVR